MFQVTKHFLTGASLSLYQYQEAAHSSPQINMNAYFDKLSVILLAFMKYIFSVTLNPLNQLDAVTSHQTTGLELAYID